MNAGPLQGTDIERKPDLRHLLAPGSIAIVGASERANAPGRRVLETLQKLGFEGRIAPVHPTNERVLGLPCFRSLQDVPWHIDAVAFCIDAKHLPDAVRQAAEKGVGAGVIYGAVRDDTAPGAASVREKIVTLARAHGIALCGPNCMGAMSPVHRSSLYLQSLVDASRLAGNVALVTQSGSIAVGMLGDCRRFGFSHLISSGDELVTTIDQYIEYLIDDPATRVIALFIESVRNVAAFTAALDRAARVGKPVVVLKVGRSAQAREAVLGHTGGIAGDGRVFSALIERHHGIEVSSLEEMTEVVACCQSTRRPAGPRVGVVTASGGQVEMILDEAVGATFDLPPLNDSLRARAAEIIGPISGPGNPLDAWGTGDYTRSLAHGLDVLSGNSDIDSVVLVSDTNDGQTMTPTRYTDLLYDASSAIAQAVLFHEHALQSHADGAGGQVSKHRSGHVDRIAPRVWRNRPYGPLGAAIRTTSCRRIYLRDGRRDPATGGLIAATDDQRGRRQVHRPGPGDCCGGGPSGVDGAGRGAIRRGDRLSGGPEGGER